MIALLLDNDVGMTRNLLPASALFHPNGRDAKMRGLARIRHFSTPSGRFTSGHNNCVLVDVYILNLPVEGPDGKVS